jgi:hypothetical protein
MFPKYSKSINPIMFVKIRCDICCEVLCETNLCTHYIVELKMFHCYIVSPRHGVQSAAWPIFDNRGHATVNGYAALCSARHASLPESCATVIALESPVSYAGREGKEVQMQGEQRKLCGKCLTSASHWTTCQCLSGSLKDMVFTCEFEP